MFPDPQDIQYRVSGRFAPSNKASELWGIYDDWFWLVAGEESEFNLACEIVNTVRT